MMVAKDFFVNVKMIKYEYLHCEGLCDGKAYFIKFLKQIDSPSPFPRYCDELKEIIKIIIGKKESLMSVSGFMETLIYEKENDLIGKIINDKHIVFENKVYNINKILNNNNIFSYKDKKYSIGWSLCIENEEKN